MTAELVAGGPISDTIIDGSITILDNNLPPVVSFESVTVTEGITAVVPISLSRVSAQPITLTVTITDGTPLTITDLATGPFTITIPAGSPTATLSITTADDLLNEAPEPFTVTLDIANSGPISTTFNAGTILLLDNDTPPIVSIGSLTVTEGLTATVPISISEVSGQPITLTLAITDGLSLPILDFPTDRYTVTIPTGSPTATLTISTVADLLDEPNEPLRSRLSFLRAERLAENV